MLELSLTSAKEAKQYTFTYNFQLYKFKNSYGGLSSKVDHLILSIEQMFVPHSILIKKAIFFSKQSLYYILILIICSFMAGFLGQIKQNSILQWIGIGFGIGLSALELLFIFFVKYLKDIEAMKMIEKGIIAINKFNQIYGKTLNLHCRLYYNLGLGMRLMFGLPAIYFEIKLFSTLDNLSQVLNEKEKIRKNKSKEIKDQFGLQKGKKEQNFSKKISLTEFSEQQQEKKQFRELL